MNKPSIIIQWGRKKRLEKNKKGDTRDWDLNQQYRCSV